MLRALRRGCKEPLLQDFSRIGWTRSKRSRSLSFRFHSFQNLPSLMVSVSTVVAAALLATTAYVDAHGTLAKPALKFTGPNDAGDFYALVPMNALTPQPGDIFTNYPDANLNAAAFGRAFKASNYKSFKEFILKNQDLSKGRFSNPKTPECGFTDPNGPVVSLPDQLEWYGGQMNHPGPCEVWCDDELV
ncbi:hypothetical protein Ae201684_010341 [Aphanomyces euteiches]|uniref:Uncharacterized protein n=1 Tax=Aphanomyces euteiches TaxID=100861 RepID=A0A6G0WYK1_9STRA|nr:hypothetical protein Ae201684_010341 [Aphanomyces euteiches]